MTWQVLGPAIYGPLYVRGKAAGMPVLPFVLNLLLTSAALILAPFALRGVSGEAEEGKRKEG